MNGGFQYLDYSFLVPFVLSYHSRMRGKFLPHSLLHLENQRDLVLYDIYEGSEILSPVFSLSVVLVPGRAGVQDGVWIQPLH